MTRIARAALFALFVLALALRLPGSDRLLPYLPEPDSYVVTQARLLRQGESAERPLVFYSYPLLLARTLLLFPDPSVAPETPADELLDAHLAAVSADFVRLRVISALLSACLVPATWWLARRFLSTGGALLAAFFVATSLLHLLFSSQARPHGVHATLALLSVLASLRLARKPSWDAYALAAFAAALAVACLHNGAFVLLPLVAAHVLRARDPERAQWWRIAVPLAAVALAVVLLYPRPPTLQDEGGTFELGGHTLHFDSLNGAGFALASRFLWDHDPALLLLATLGLVLALFGARAWRERSSEARKDLWIVLAYALPYGFALGIYGETYDRFLLPLVPYLACLASSGLARIVAVVAGAQSSRIRAGLAGALVGAAGMFPAFIAGRFASVRVAPDTIEQATEWVVRDTERGTRPILTTPSLALPLFHAPDSLAAASGDHVSRNAQWIAWQIEHPLTEAQAALTPRYPLWLTPGKLVNMGMGRTPADIAAFLDERKPELAVLEVSRRMMFLPQVRALRDEVRARGTLVASFAGGADEDCTAPPMEYQDVPRMVSRLLRASAFGPCVEIYRLR